MYMILKFRLKNIIYTIPIALFDDTQNQIDKTLAAQCFQNAQPFRYIMRLIDHMLSQSYNSLKHLAIVRNTFNQDCSRYHEIRLFLTGMKGSTGAFFFDGRTPDASGLLIRRGTLYCGGDRVDLIWLSVLVGRPTSVVESVDTSSALRF